MFGVPIDGSANVFCDNEAIYNYTITPDSGLKKKHNYTAEHRCRDAVSDKTIRVVNQVTYNNISVLFSKIMTSALGEGSYFRSLLTKIDTYLQKVRTTSTLFLSVEKVFSWHLVFQCK